MQTLGLAYTVKEFCQHARISERLYFKLQSRGEGPPVIRIGRRTVISREAARKWMMTREALSNPFSGSPEDLKKLVSDCKAIASF
jgi:hypothetical protein